MKPDLSAIRARAEAYKEYQDDFSNINPDDAWYYGYITANADIPALLDYIEELEGDLVAYRENEDG